MTISFSFPRVKGAHRKRHGFQHPSQSQYEQIIPDPFSRLEDMHFHMCRCVAPSLKTNSPPLKTSRMANKKDLFPTAIFEGRAVSLILWGHERSTFSSISCSVQRFQRSGATFRDLHWCIQKSPFAQCPSSDVWRPNKRVKESKPKIKHAVAV